MELQKVINLKNKTENGNKEYIGQKTNIKMRHKPENINSDIKCKWFKCCN